MSKPLSQNVDSLKQLLLLFFLKMSVILIKDHNECIYDVKKVDPIIYEKPPRYISKFNDTIKERAAERWQKKTHGTMGLAEENLPDPHNFLKKHTGQQASSTTIKQKIEPLQKSSKLPNVPTVEECKKAYKRPIPNQNFVAKNIKTVKNMKAKEAIPKVVIDSSGTTKLLSHGLEPVYIKSTEYAKTPEYLKKFRKMRERKEQIMKEVVKLEQKKCHYITKDERDELLNVCCFLRF